MRRPCTIFALCLLAGYVSISCVLNAQIDPELKSYEWPELGGGGGDVRKADTIAAMQALTDLVDGDQITTAGAFINNDGRGRLYRYFSTPQTDEFFAASVNTLANTIAPVNQRDAWTIGQKVVLRWTTQPTSDPQVRTDRLYYVNGVPSAGQYTLSETSPGGATINFSTAGTGVEIGSADDGLDVLTTPNDQAGFLSTQAGSLVAKGDLHVSDGVKRRRLPIGLDAQLLTADPASHFGLAWRDPELRRFNTLNDAVAAANLRDGQLVVTLEYSAGSGGGNAYQFSTSSSETADGGFVIDATGGQLLALNRNHKIANVLQFGADPTGAAPAQAIIAQAQTSVGSGGVVYYPKGSYNIAASVTLSPNVTHCFHNNSQWTATASMTQMATTNAFTAGQKIIDGTFDCNALAQRALAFTASNNVRLQGTTTVSNAAAGGDPSYAAVQFIGGDSIDIETLRVDNVKSGTNQYDAVNFSFRTASAVDITNVRIGKIVSNNVDNGVLLSRVKGPLEIGTVVVNNASDNVVYIIDASTNIHIGEIIGENNAEGFAFASNAPNCHITVDSVHLASDNTGAPGISLRGGAAGNGLVIGTAHLKDCRLGSTASEFYGGATIGELVVDYTQGTTNPVYLSNNNNLHIGDMSLNFTSPPATNVAAVFNSCQNLRLGNVTINESADTQVTSALQFNGTAGGIVDRVSLSDQASIIDNRGTGRVIYEPTLAGVVNVKDAPYFAAGDGTTDDSAAINAAVAAAGATGSIVLPEGVFLFNGTQLVSNGSAAHAIRSEDTTPDVTGISRVYVSTSAGLTITGLDGHVHEGKRVAIFVDSSGVTINHGPTFVLEAGANFAPANTGLLVMEYSAVKSAWHEVTRVVYP